MHLKTDEAGTTRVVSREEDGVVNLTNPVFGVANLFISGSSAFPISASANPTQLVAAMTRRQADHLIGRLKACCSAVSKRLPSQIFGEFPAMIPALQTFLWVDS